jgi:hypothetical protein
MCLFCVCLTNRMGAMGCVIMYIGIGVTLVTEDVFGYDHRGSDIWGHFVVPTSNCQVCSTLARHSRPQLQCTGGGDEY